MIPKLINPEQKKLLFNEYFETAWGKVLVLWQYFQVLVSTLENEIRKYVQIVTRLRTLPAFPSPRALKRLACGLPFQNTLGPGNASKVGSLVFALLHNTSFKNFQCTVSIRPQKKDLE